MLEQAKLGGGRALIPQGAVRQRRRMAYDRNAAAKVGVETEDMGEHGDGEAQKWNGTTSNAREERQMMNAERATVVVTGDAAMGAAILDGMAAARMRQELEAARRELEEQRRKNDIRASRERSYWARKIALARKRYGDNRPLRGPRRWALCALALLVYAYGEFWKFEERRWRE